MERQNRGADWFEIGLALALVMGLMWNAAGNAQEVAKPEVVEVQSEEPLISEKVMKSIQDLIDRVDLKARIKADVSREDFGGGAYWERKIEPSYRLGYTSLIDDYMINARYSPEAVRGFERDVGYALGTNGQVRVMFARQFEGNRARDKLKLAIEKPYTPFTHLPLSAKRAREKLVPTDFVMIQAYLNLVVSASQLGLLVSPFPATVTGYYVLSGEFQVHLFRLSENKFRLKLVGVRGRDLGIGVRVGYDPDLDIKISKIDFLDSLVGGHVRKRIRFTPLEFGSNRPRSNLFLIDYLLDFSDEEVRGAYDDLIQSAWRLKTTRMLNPFNSREELKQMLIGDVSKFEELYEREKDKKSVADRVVERMWRGSNDIQDGGGIAIKIGHPELVRWRYNETYTENFISMVDRDNRRRNFLMPTYSLNGASEYLFGVFDEEAQRSANLLLETDSGGKITSFGEVSFQLEYRDRKFREKEIRRLQAMVRSRIPQEIYDRIDWKGWSRSGDRTNARVTTLLVFRPQALAFVEGLGVAEIYNQLIAYGNSLPRIEAVPATPWYGQGENTNHTRFDWKYHYDLVEVITPALATVFDGRRTARERMDAFTGMRTNQLWQEIGSGFLVRLLETEAKRKGGNKGLEDLLKSIYFETTWEAKNEDTVHEVIGLCKNRRLYKAVQYIYAILYNRSIDMRLIDDDQVPGLPDSGHEDECEPAESSIR